ncbi:response regulator [Anabaena cylindrica FACHB-243]|uniref:Response regulator receiver protein n=1 Tax=Anabaena cylindrica (strain ATCC 27899 / PCC 7122) TaxID=272123 RepID=K9ZJ87_ANACC|nr:MULTISPECIES: response regulator [Anabaena]AFZ59256.1 response regulator receiver protein [Anabaena cylindrica PCC 7122]MBD2416611.1 response regulator [Anabaena cylindrica FACHB-243]MBY5285432.1 response regulator [Anabaena sp. CCAP 1446/1C]MBY5310740.1 response regulator [Anabaena sp. CCAP 1446/1C]MCM2407551.1 response regulator [Anabaena sp. CCAP 1446/1C]
MHSQSIHLDNLRLLIVDDDSDTRQILTLLFELEGAEIISVASASEAIEIISKFKPDILISDISLPDEDGCSLLPKVRNLEALQGRWFPAIAMTGWASAEDKEYTLKAGFQKHLSKPVNLDELVSAVANLVDSNQYVNSF